MAIGKARRTEGALAHADTRRKQVHEAIIERLLLRTIFMVLIAGRGLRPVQPEWIDGIRPIGEIGRVGIVRQQTAGQAIDRRGAGFCYKHRLTRRIRGLRIRGEVMIKRDILLKQDHQVFNWSGRIAGGLRGADQQ